MQNQWISCTPCTFSHIKRENELLAVSYYPIVFRKWSEIKNIQAYILGTAEGRRESYLNTCITLLGKKCKKPIWLFWLMTLQWKNWSSALGLQSPSVTACSVASLLTQENTQTCYSRTNIFNAFNYIMLKHTNVLQSTPRPQIELLGLLFLKVTDVPESSHLPCYFTLDKYKSEKFLALKTYQMFLMFAQCIHI